MFFEKVLPNPGSEEKTQVPNLQPPASLRFRIVHLQNWHVQRRPATKSFSLRFGGRDVYGYRHDLFEECWDVHDTSSVDYFTPILYK